MSYAKSGEPYTFTRRSLARLLALMPFGAIAKPKPKLASGAEILRSFDARDWAKHFIEHVRESQSIATDEEMMTTWFANALMRGYDERSRTAWQVVPIRGRTAFEVRGAPEESTEKLNFFIRRDNHPEELFAVSFHITDEISSAEALAAYLAS